MVFPLKPRLTITNRQEARSYFIPFTTISYFIPFTTIKPLLWDDMALQFLRGWPGKREIHWAGQRGNKQSMGREEFVDLPNTLAFP